MAQRHIDEVKRSLGFGGGLYGGAIKLLASRLGDDEDVVAVTTGGLGSATEKPVILAATTERVIVAGKFLMMQWLYEFPYDRINSIGLEGAAGAGAVRINSGGEVIVVYALAPGEAQAVVEAAQARVHELAREPHSPIVLEASDPVAQLERLAALRAAGVISDDEFDTAKAQLLGRL